MATTKQIIDAALSNILVRAEEEPREASEYQDAIFALNNYMLDLDANGVSLGFTEVNSLNDTLTVPNGALRGIIFNLALELAPQFAAPVSPQLMQMAMEGEVTMRKLGQPIGVTQYPNTLPIGSGNEGNYVYSTGRFYNNNEESILAEATGAVSLERGTEDALNP